MLLSKHFYIVQITPFVNISTADVYKFFLGLSSPGLIKLPLGITGSPSLTYTAPITLGSWWQGSAGGLSGRIGFHKSINEKLQAGLSLGAGTGLLFSQSGGPTRPDDLANLRRDEAGIPVYICRQANTLCDSGWVNSAFNLNAGINTSWAFMKDRKSVV